MARPKPIGQWKRTNTTTSNNFEPACKGNYQERIHQDSRGHLYVVNAEKIVGIQFRIRLYSNVGATPSEIDLDFPDGATMSFVSETSTAYGYDYDQLVSLLEISSVLYGRKIYVAAIHTHPVQGLCVEIISFDIAGGTTSVESVEIYNPDIFGENQEIRSVDIDMAKNKNFSPLWVGVTNFSTLQQKVRHNWYALLIPPEPTARGTIMNPVTTYIQGDDTEGHGYYQAIRHCHDELFSITHTHMEISLPQGPTPGDGTATLDQVIGWLIPDDERSSFHYSPQGYINHLPICFKVQSLAVNEEIEQWGSLDINYNAKYDAKMLLRWRVDVPYASNPQKFQLWFGVHENGVITYSDVILELDYTNMNFPTSIDDLLEAGIYPECGIIVNTKGETFIVASAPALDNDPWNLVAPGIGDINGIPFYDIAVLHFPTNDWYSPVNKDWQYIEDGSDNTSSCRYISTPNYIDGFRQPLHERLYFTCHDYLDSLDTFTVFTRHPGT